MYAALGIAYGAVARTSQTGVSFALWGPVRGRGGPGVVDGRSPSLFYLVLYAPLIGLRAIQSPSSVFVAYSGAATVALALGFPLTAAFGLKGAIVSLCVANSVGAMLGIWLFFRKTNGGAGESACPTIEAQETNA